MRHLPAKVSSYRRNVAAHVSHIILLHMLHLTTKLDYLPNRENHIHQYMSESTFLSAIRTITSMRLSSHASQWCEGEGGCWGTSDVRVVDYVAIFTLWYNVLPMIIFQLCFPYVFDRTQSLDEVLSTVSSVRSRLQHSLVKGLEHRILREDVICFWSDR